MAIVPENRRLLVPRRVLENLELGAYLNMALSIADRGYAAGKAGEL